MITARTIGANGRLGNQLFQAAFLLAQAWRNNVKIGWREWEYARYFKGDFRPSLIPIAKTVIEPAFHCTPDFYESLDWSNDIDFHGYFQSAKYWEGCEDLIRQSFSFSDELTESVKGKNMAAIGKETIAIHIRRGDYVGNSAYVQLPPIYYLTALERHFPNWRKCNLVIFSDDSQYARMHFGCFQNAYFTDGSDIEDLCLMAMCNNHIIANSSFSWWGAWLAGSKKVVRPERHFAGKLAHHDTRDLYPAEWLSHEVERLDLSDVTFMIPVGYDSQDRVKNLELVLDMLMCNFDTNIMVCEHNGDRFKWAAQYADYSQFQSPYFHRTRMLNEMATESRTPIIVNYDADVFMPPAQVMEAVKMIRDGMEVVYPYSGRFVRIPRMHSEPLKKSLDVGTLAGVNFPVLRPADNSSTGGCIFFDKEAFWRGGGENENMVSFSPDDRERFYRFTTLGFKVARTGGNLWHIEHFCGSNSGVNHPMMRANKEEWAKVSKMGKGELEEYVSSWQSVAA